MTATSLQNQPLTIARLGADGDGVADGADGPIFIAGALPGERVRAWVDGQRGGLIAVEAPSADRIAPVCAHFGGCGGCALQHLAGPASTAFKRTIIADALAKRGLAATIAAPWVARPGTRRRVTLTAMRADRVVTLGFYGPRSTDLIAISMCAIAAPEIVAALEGLKAMLRPLLAADQPARVVVTATVTGLDVAISGVRGLSSPAERVRMAKDAQALDLARLTIGDELVIETRPPIIQPGGVDVVVPPGAFLQATADSEAELIRLVTAGVGKAKTVADLFAGLGTFSLPLAKKAKVTAVETDAAALAALDAARRGASGLKPITPLARDLVRWPLSARELAGFDAVVFDPPRAGAKEQAGEIAKSKVPRIVAVSCNPMTFARDARILVDGGFRLESVQPVDQFLFSAHVELVATFSRLK